MATTNVMTEHFKEMTEFKTRQKKEWGELLKEQEATLAKETNTEGLAELFTKQRDEHNKKFAQEKKALLQKQQTELEQLKERKGRDRSNDEIER